MARKSTDTSVLTIRVPRVIAQKLEREARRQRRTRSGLARDLLVATLESQAGSDLASEARRQSLIAAAHPAERRTLKVFSDMADLRGWE